MTDEAQRLTDFLADRGPTLRPFQDHNGFPMHDELRAAMRAQIATLTDRLGVMREALERAEKDMEGVTVFVRSHQRIKQPEGDIWWEEAIVRVRAGLNPPTPIQEGEDHG